MNNWVCSRNRKLTAVVCSWRYWLTTFNRFSFSTVTFWVYLPTYTCMSICNRISVQKWGVFFCGWGLFIYQWHNCWKETYFICCWGFFPFLFFFNWILNHCLALKLQGMNWSPDILLLDFLVESRIHGFIIHSKSSGSWSSKATHNHDTITRSDCWYEVLLPKYCVSFTNRQVLFPSFFWFLINMHIFSQIHLWRIQII